jgi:ParB family chromosome partitioning protein
MTVKRLGKGIGALIPDLPQSVDLEYKLAEIDINKIRSNPHQPRKQFGVMTMEELKNSIREKGIVQPITVRQIDDEFEIIAGERRLRASKELGLKFIPSYILPVKSDVEMIELAIIENVQREDLNPIEEAEAYSVLIENFNLSHEEIAEKVGKDRSTITNCLRLLNLPEPIIKDLRNRELSAGHARAILSLNDEKQEINLWRRIKRDGLSVRAVETLVKRSTERTLKKDTQRRTSNKSLFIKNIEDNLMHKLGTRVKIKEQGNKGKIEIDYYSKEDLNRLLEIFNLIKEL